MVNFNNSNHYTTTRQCRNFTSPFLILLLQTIQNSIIKVFVFVFKIYLNTVAIKQLELIFNGPCNYNKNVQFRKNVKPTTDQLHAMVGTYYNLNYNNYITKYQ